MFAEAVETAKSRCCDYDFRLERSNEWRSKSKQYPFSGVQENLLKEIAKKPNCFIDKPLVVSWF